jgi:hypothetical protein
VTAPGAVAFRGAIFDIDGIVVDSPHEKAWRESLRELMESEWSDIRDCTIWSPEAFTSRVYEEQPSGKPRLAGARAALEYFHIPDDEEENRLLEYAARRPQMVVRLIEADEFTAYPDALRFIIRSCAAPAAQAVRACSEFQWVPLCRRAAGTGGRAPCRRSSSLRVPSAPRNACNQGGYGGRLAGAPREWRRSGLGSFSWALRRRRWRCGCGAAAQLR